MSKLTLEQKKKLLHDLTRDPLVTSKTLFNSKLWSKQEEIIRSVWEHPRTAVASCNSGGKSRIAAEIALLYLISFPPARVITTAPTFTQVEEILWKEIAALYHNSKFPIGGTLNKTSLELGVIDGKPWDAMGISTNEVNRFQGFKSPHLLVILDEALGVAPEIWEAMEGLQPHRILAIGNPLDPSGNFFDCFQSRLWNKIYIDAYEAIEWQKKYGKIPGLVSAEWVEERRSEWGDKSPLFISRVRGQFPTETADTLIIRKWVDEARKRKNDEDSEEDSARVVAMDLASKHGECETVVIKRYGHTVKAIKGYYRQPVNVSADVAAFEYGSFKPSFVAVDSDGIGEGLSDILASRHIPVLEFHGGYGQRAIDYDRFRNLRSQFYWNVAKKFEKGLYSLNQLDDKSYELLKNQLCSIKVKAPDAQGRIQIETKEDLAARGIKSPDYADAFVYGEYGFYMTKYYEVKEMMYR